MQVYPEYLPNETLFFVLAHTIIPSCSIFSLFSLEDEPESQVNFEKKAQVLLEYWARDHRREDTHNLIIDVALEEERFTTPPMRFSKIIKLYACAPSFSHILFHVQKKNLFTNLRYMAAIAVANKLSKESDAEKLHIPRTLIPDVKKAFNNCWVTRDYQSKTDHDVKKLKKNKKTKKTYKTKKRF